MGKVAEARRHGHLPVRVEFGRVDDDPPLHSPIVADPARAAVPPIAAVVLERGPVPCPFGEPAWPVGDRVVRCVSERPERLVRRVDAVRVHVELRARRSVLQVIAAAVLGHPRPLHVRGAGLAGLPAGAMVLSEPLPAVPVRVKRQHRRGLALVRLLAVTEADLLPVHRKHVRRAPVEVPLTVIVLEQGGVPRSRRHFAGLHFGRVLVHRARQRRHASDEEVELAGVRRAARQDGAGLRHRRLDDDPGPVRPHRRCDDAPHRPAARRDERPVDHVGGAPVAVRERQEEVIDALVVDDRRVRPGAIGGAVIDLLEIVAVIEVDRD